MATEPRCIGYIDRQYPFIPFVRRLRYSLNPARNHFLQAWGIFDGNTDSSGENVWGKH